MQPGVEVVVKRRRRLLTAVEGVQTTGWIAAQQRPSGEIPWYRGGKMDPWDHVHAAMGLTVGGRFAEARAAYRWLAENQEKDGGFVAERSGDDVVNAHRESNHASYLASGLWHFYLARPDADFLGEMWRSL